MNKDDIKNMKCENCFNEKLCKTYQVLGLNDYGIDLHEDFDLDNCECKLFKDKNLIVELPFKISQDIFFINNGKVVSGKIRFFAVGKKDTVLYIDFRNIGILTASVQDLGKSFFLTKNEAKIIVNKI